MSKSMRSYSSEDLNNFRKQLHNQGIKLDQLSLVRVIKMYQEFLREELLSGKTVLISGIGTISSSIRKKSLLINRETGERMTDYRYHFSLKTQRSFRDEMNKRFNKVKEEKLKENKLNNQNF